MPRVQKSSGKTRHDPLHVQLGEDEVHAKYGNVSQPGKRKKSRKSADHEDDTEVQDSYAYFYGLLTFKQAILDPKTSKKIFELAQDQQEELEESDSDEEDDLHTSDKNAIRTTQIIDDDDDDEGMRDFGDEDVDVDAELELVSTFLS
jgi:essential nuclear protein 1